jgi:hypothetical protein
MGWPISNMAFSSARMENPLPTNLMVSCCPVPPNFRVLSHLVFTNIMNWGTHILVGDDQVFGYRPMFLESCLANCDENRVLAKRAKFRLFIPYNGSYL